MRAVTGTTPPAAPAPQPASPRASQLAPDTDPRRWRMLALLALAEVLGMCAWFAGNAVAPSLAAEWGLTPSEVGGLTTAVQLGFVFGTAVIAVANLADIVPARALYAVCAILAAAANAALLGANGYSVALMTRFATGAFLAGVYPPVMKMAATWFRARRGLAVGTVVGALTVGKALPYLLKSFPALTATHIVLSASAAAVIAAAFVWLEYRDGPYAFPSPRFSWTLVRDVLHGRRYRLALGGYLGHMAELYSYWTWIPAFLAASAMARSGTTSSWVNLLAFATVAIGGAGCVWGGLVADRIGRARLTIVAMAASGACALLVALSFGASWFIMTPLALAWGFFVIADSAQFSVLVTESVPPHAVGTALTMQTSLGFLLTTITIQLVPPVVDAASWSAAFAMLAVGPVLGIWSIARLMREPKTDAAR
ncbi:MAG TPA: MFS transporter [Gemmatimonadaceae bacterium]|nr:MFS transporter [Gemmatimonadaceae bacterium]